MIKMRENDCLGNVVSNCDDRWRLWRLKQWRKVTISDSGGRGGVTSEAAVRKSGSYGLERTERGASEEPVRKNKGGPWRMVGDGAIVVYRRLIINPR